MLPNITFSEKIMEKIDPEGEFTQKDKRAFFASLIEKRTIDDIFHLGRKHRLFNLAETNLLYFVVHIDLLEEIFYLWKIMSLLGKILAYYLEEESKNTLWFFNENIEIPISKNKLMDIIILSDFPDLYFEHTRDFWAYRKIEDQIGHPIPYKDIINIASFIPRSEKLGYIDFDIAPQFICSDFAISISPLAAYIIYLYNSIDDQNPVSYIEFWLYYIFQFQNCLFQDCLKNERFNNCIFGIGEYKIKERNLFVIYITSIDENKGQILNFIFSTKENLRYAKNHLISKTLNIKKETFPKKIAVLENIALTSEIDKFIIAANINPETDERIKEQLSFNEYWDTFFQFLT